MVFHNFALYLFVRDYYKASNRDAELKQQSMPLQKQVSRDFVIRMIGYVLCFHTFYIYS